MVIALSVCVSDLWVFSRNVGECLRGVVVRGIIN